MTIPTLLDEMISLSYQHKEETLEDPDIQQKINTIARNLLCVDLKKWDSLPSRVPFNSPRKAIIKAVLQQHREHLESYLPYFNDQDKALLFRSDSRCHCHIFTIQEDTKLTLNNPYLTHEELIHLLSQIPPIQRERIQHLDLCNTAITFLAPFIELFPNLTSCYAHCCPALKELGFSHPFPLLTELHLANCNLLRDLQTIQYIEIFIHSILMVAVCYPH